MRPKRLVLLVLSWSMGGCRLASLAVAVLVGSGTGKSSSVLPAAAAAAAPGGVLRPHPAAPPVALATESAAEEDALDLPNVADIIGGSPEDVNHQDFGSLAESVVEEAERLKVAAQMLLSQGPVDIVQSKAGFERKLQRQRNETRGLAAHNAQVAAAVRKLRDENEAYRKEAIRLRTGNSKISKQLREIQAALSASTRQFMADASQGAAAGAAESNDTATSAGSASAAPPARKQQGLVALQRTAVGQQRGRTAGGKAPPDAADDSSDDAPGDSALVLSAGGAAQEDGTQDAAAADQGEPEDEAASQDPPAEASPNQDDVDASAEDAATALDADSGLGVLSFLGTSTAVKYVEEQDAQSPVNADADELRKNAGEVLKKHLRALSRSVDAAVRVEREAQSKLEALFHERFNAEKRKQDSIVAKLRPLENRMKSLKATQRGIVNLVQHQRAVRERLEKQLRQQQQALKKLEHLATE